MPKYRLDLAYDGTDFHGYARQPKLRTVQGELEQALSRHTGPINTSVAGRTDRGVHAAGQVVSFSIDETLEADYVLRSLNSQLGDDISVLRLRAVHDDFHARYSAIARAYRYEILNRPILDPMRVRTAWHVRDALDVDLLNQTSAILVGRHDFASFCRKAEGKSTERVVMWAGWRGVDDGVELSIAANAFCHQMVRSVVADLVEVGRGRVAPAKLATILEARDRNEAGGTAPPQGLTLIGVGYPGEPIERPDWITSTP